MIAVFLFGLTLFLAVLLSDLAERSVLSTAVLFLLAGFIAGPGGLGVVHPDPGAPFVSHIVTLALFSTLFTDGMRVGIRELAHTWRLPGRALLFGLPLTVLGTAILAHWIANLPWREAFLLSAVLAPTDPVFAADLVRREELSGNLRQLLNVESGVNDGIALPLVLWLIHTGESTGDLLVPLGVGIIVGIAVPWIADRLEKSRWFQAHTSYRPLAAFAVAVLVFSVAALVHGNEFLAAFAAGVTVISVRPEVSSEFRSFAEDLANLLKFAALFLFGSLLTPALFTGLTSGEYVFALLALIAVRPLALSLALIRSGMDRQDQLVAGWFGPKGFASVLYAILVTHAGVPGGSEIFGVAALVIGASILFHSSTSALAARWLTARTTA